MRWRVAKRKSEDANMQKLWRRAVRVMRGDNCLRCGSFADQCHHVIKRRFLVLRHDWRNGIPLCRACHRWVEDRAMGAVWAEDQVDMDYLLDRAVPMQAFLKGLGLTRDEFLERQTEELKDVLRRCE